MDLLSRLFGRQKQAPRGIFAPLLGNSAPDMTATERLAAYKGWVYACVNAISEEVAGIELQLQKRSGKEWINVEEHISMGPIHTVNPNMSSDELWMWTQGHLELDGNAFWYLPPGKLVRKPLEIWPLDPTRVTVVKSETNIIGGYVYKNEKQVDIPLPSNEVIHFKRFNPRNRYRGVGTVEAAALAIDIDTYSATWNRNFFYNSATPSAVLETEQTLTKEQFDNLRVQWEAKYSGIDNAHKTAILEGGLTFKQAGLSQKDMEFLAQRTWSRDEILGIFRVPRTVLGITDDVNRANAEATDYVFAKRVVRPRMAFLCSRLTEFYLPLFGLDGRDWRVTFKDPVPENTEADLKAKQISLANLPWKTIDEIRADEGLDPLPDNQGEQLLVPGTFKTIDQVLNPPDPLALPTGDEEETPPGKSVTKSASDQLVTNRIRFVTREIKKRAKDYKKILRDQKKQVLERLRSKEGAKTFKGKKDADDMQRANELVRFLFADWDDWIGVILNPTEDALKTSLEFGGKKALQQLGVDQTFDLLNPRVLDWLNTNALQHARSISDTTKDQVTLRIMEGVEQGKGAEDIAKAIEEFLDGNAPKRSLMIARAEVISGYAEGSLAGYRQSTVVKSKQWLTAGDERVDPECALNEEQGSIPLETAFASGHMAPITHPNCRCVLQPVTGTE